MNSIVDLHMHSAASDGSDMIPELLAKIHYMELIKKQLQLRKQLNIVMMKVDLMDMK